MFIFVPLAFAGFLVVAGAFIFGHDHDVDHDVDHDGGYEVGGTLSFFSVRVLATFVMGFGAAGAIARYYHASYPVSSLIGLGAGVVLSALMYLVILVFIKQQASSVISTESLVGRVGNVTVPIEKAELGEVGVSVGGEYKIYSAHSRDQSSIQKGRRVKVVRVIGTTLVVEQEKQE